MLIEIHPSAQVASSVRDPAHVINRISLFADGQYEVHTRPLRVDFRSHRL
jgi:hypothetical protein